MALEVPYTIIISRPTDYFVPLSRGGQSHYFVIS